MADFDLPIIAVLLEQHLDSTKVWPDGRIIHIRRRVATIRDLQIQVWPHDHQPPHFHVVSAVRGINARFDLSSLAVIDVTHGSLSRADERKIQDFFRHRPDALAFLRSEHERLTPAAA